MVQEINVAVKCSECDRVLMERTVTRDFAGPDDQKHYILFVDRCKCTPSSSDEATP